MLDDNELLTKLRERRAYDTVYSIFALQMADEILILFEAKRRRRGANHILASLPELISTMKKYVHSSIWLL